MPLSSTASLNCRYNDGFPKRGYASWLVLWLALDVFKLTLLQREKTGLKKTAFSHCFLMQTSVEKPKCAHSYLVSQVSSLD